MKTNSVYITQHDLKRLKKLVDGLPDKHLPDGFSLQELAEELNHGIVVSPKEVPENVITMNSRVLLREVSTGETMTCWLVFPDKVDAVKNPVSILSSLGIAMIGYKIGDVFTWESPRGAQEMEVLDILYQPERVGNFKF